jgi:hypothetical protein
LNIALHFDFGDFAAFPQAQEQGVSEVQRHLRVEQLRRNEPGGFDCESKLLKVVSIDERQHAALRVGKALPGNLLREFPIGKIAP